MEVAILLGLVLLNGVFAMAEIALMSARKARMQKLVDAGDRNARAAVTLGEDPDTFLSTVQIGITSIGILNGIVGEAMLAKPFSAWLQTIGVPLPPADYAATILIVICITYLSIIFGELVPKRLGHIYAEQIACSVARPMLYLATLTKPFVWLLARSTQVVMRAVGVRGDDRPAVTEEEIHQILADGSDAGVIEHTEHAMVRNVFRLDDRHITSFMVPRGEAAFFDKSDSLEVNLAKLEASGHSRFPVVDGGWDKIVGVIAARQMLAQSLRGEQLDFASGLEPAVYVPETMSGMELLEKFKLTGVQLVFIVDEFGEVQGIVTLHDVLEAITGEFKTEQSEDSWAVQREDGSWLLDGLIPVPELKDRLAITELPEEERGRYQTLSGMLTVLIGDLPKITDRCEWGDWVFEIVDMDGLRIDKVLAMQRLAVTHDGPQPA